jgi:hypothetical protein
VAAAAAIAAPDFAVSFMDISSKIECGRCNAYKP